MYVLAADTSQGICSVAISKNQNILVSREETTPSKQAELLMLMVEECLQSCKITYNDIELLASTVGPGSFTGLRISLSAFQALALATKIPTIGVTTLHILAHSKKNSIKAPLTTAIINARRNQYYIQTFNTYTSEPIDHPSLIYTDKLQRYLDALKDDTSLITNIDTIENINIHTTLAPHATDTALLAEHLYNRNDNTSPLTPLYIREPDATPAKAPIV